MPRRWILLAIPTKAVTRRRVFLGRPGGGAFEGLSVSSGPFSFDSDFGERGGWVIGSGSEGTLVPSAGGFLDSGTASGWGRWALPDWG